MDWHYSVFWIVLILKFTLGEHCNETLNTVRNVSSCPLDKEEWQAAAKRMDCNRIQMTKNCENVTYHCLRHAVTKKMVEVCTVPRNLKGFCPHFYQDPPYVRDDYKRDCSSSSMCPPFYSSKDAYNYSACYNDTSIPTTISSSDVLKPTSVTTFQNIHVSADGISKGTEKSNNTWKWVLPLIVILVFLLIVVYIIAVAWVTKSKRKSVREALCLHQHIFQGCRKDTQVEKDGKENEDSEKADEKILLLSEENIEGNTGTCNKDNECDKRNINEEETYEKDVSPESEKETTFHQTYEKSPIKVDLGNKSSIKSLTQKDDFTEGGTSDNKGLDTSSNNANQTSYKTTALQLRDAKEPMRSDSTEDKRDTVEGDIKTTSEFPQKETPQTEEKVTRAGGLVDEGNTNAYLTKSNPVDDSHTPEENSTQDKLRPSKSVQINPSGSSQDTNFDSQCNNSAQPENSHPPQISELQSIIRIPLGGVLLHSEQNQEENRKEMDSTAQVCSETPEVPDDQLKTFVNLDVSVDDMMGSKSNFPKPPASLNMLQKKRIRRGSGTRPIGGDTPVKGGSELPSRNIETLEKGLGKADERIYTLLKEQNKLHGRVRYLEIKFNCINPLLIELEMDFCGDLYNTCSEKSKNHKSLKDKVSSLESEYSGVLQRIKEVESCLNPAESSEETSASTSPETSYQDDSAESIGACGCDLKSKVGNLENVLRRIEKRLNNLYEEGYGKQGQLKASLARLRVLECAVNQLEDEYGLEVTDFAIDGEKSIEMMDRANDRLFKLFGQLEILDLHILK